MRKHYIDNIRSLTIGIVAIYHVLMLYSDILGLSIGSFYAVQPWDGLMYLCYPWFMMVLFIVAGMCSRFCLDRHTVKEFRKSRTQKLLIPSTVSLFVFWWIQGIVSMNISKAEGMENAPVFVKYLIAVLSGTSILWFIQVLWVFSMLLCVVRKHEKGKLFELGGKANILVLLALFLPVWGSGYILNTPIISVYRFGIYGVCFFLGYFVFANDSVINELERYAVPLLCGAAVTGIAYMLIYFGQNFAVLPVVNAPLEVGFAWLACLAMIGGMKKWGDKETAFSAFCAKKSWGIYIFHYFALSSCALLIYRHLHLPALPCYIISVTAAFGGGLLLYEIFSRIPFLRFILLGIKKTDTVGTKEKANVQ